MGDTKLEISKTTEDPPPSSYKQISESDTEESALQPKEATKMNKSPSQEADGADEKMLSNEEKPLTEESKIDIADAKCFINDKQNGEAKLDIGDLKPAFVGMGKEELMKYANDPFWVRLRWVLFIAFWLAWLAMLVGAVLIIIAAPKCAPPTPRTWWERGPLVEVDNSIPLEELENLKVKKIHSVITKPLADSYTSMNDTTLLNLLKVAKEKDINVIISLNPTETDKFFVLSEENNEAYNEYYIWAKPSGFEDGKMLPPNNWKSKTDGSAWKNSDKRSEMYYQPNALPVLNFRNPKVIEEFSAVLKHWLEAGASGIQLHNVPHLLVDEQLTNWTIGNKPGYTHDQYDFFNHFQTTNQPGIGDVLREWRKIVKNYTDGPFMLAEDLVALESYMVNDTLTIDLPRHSNVFTTEGRLGKAVDIHTGLNSAFNILGDNWPLWTYDSSLDSLPDDVMNILIMLLPGSVLIDSKIEIEKNLIDTRDVPSIMFGSTYRTLLANDTVFAYQREWVQAGNPGYLVACNPSNQQVTVDFSSMPNVSEDITVQLLSANYTVPGVERGRKVPSDSFQMPPLSAALLTYVPKDK